MSWEPEDRAKVIAFMQEQAQRCTMCGTAGWEWEEDRYAYHAEEEFCLGCYIKSVKQEEDGNVLPGTSVTLFPKGKNPKKRNLSVKKKKKRKE